MLSEPLLAPWHAFPCDAFAVPRLLTPHTPPACPCRREIALNGWTLMLCERSATQVPAAPLSDDLSDGFKAPPVKAFSGPEIDDPASNAAPAPPTVPENSVAAVPAPASMPAPEPAVTAFSGPADAAVAGPVTTTATAAGTATANPTVAPVDDR